MIWTAATLLLGLILWTTKPFFGRRQTAVATRLEQDRERLEFLFRSLASAQRAWEKARMAEEDFRSIDGRLLQQMARLLAANPALLEGWQPEQNQDLPPIMIADGDSQAQQKPSPAGEQAGDEVPCGSCGVLLCEDFAFCPQCGAKRGEAAP